MFFVTRQNEAKRSRFRLSITLLHIEYCALQSQSGRIESSRVLYLRLVWVFNEMFAHLYFLLPTSILSHTMYFVVLLNIQHVCSCFTDICNLSFGQKASNLRSHPYDLWMVRNQRRTSKMLVLLWFGAYMMIAILSGARLVKQLDDRSNHHHNWRLVPKLPVATLRSNAMFQKYDDWLIDWLLTAEWYDTIFTIFRPRVTAKPLKQLYRIRRIPINTVECKWLKA